MVRVIDIDVLIVGGGVAGMRAAIKASSEGVNVLIVSKTPIGKGGGSVTAAFPVAVWKKYGYPMNPELGFKSGLDQTYYLGDQDIIKGIDEDTSKNFLNELEEMGIYFRRYSDGTLVTAAGWDAFPVTKDGKTVERAFLKGGIEIDPRYIKEGRWLPQSVTVATHMGDGAKSISDIIRGECIRRGIKRIENTMVTGLLTNDGAVVGAMAIDVNYGELFAIRAKSTILATGHGGYFWTYSSSTREECGEGLAMAYIAGAELNGMEMNWWHMAEIAWPDCWNRLQIYGFPCPPRMDMPHFYNSKGERFMVKYGITKRYKDEYDLPAYFAQCLAISNERKAGRIKGSWDNPERGGFYASYRHLDPEAIQLMDDFNYQFQFLRKLGIDPSKDLIELGVDGHMHIGGIEINKNCETNLLGLYAIGGVAATYWPTFNTCMWSGKVAGGQASKRAKEIQKPELNRGQIDDAENKLNKLLQTCGKGIRPIQIKNKIREIMWNKMHIVKTEKRMKEGLAELERVRDEMLPKMRIRSNTKYFNYDIIEALEVESMLLCCELDIESSLLRKESRGCFVRDDYPTSDDRNWLKNILVKLVDGKAEYRLKPVNLKYMKPTDFEEPLPHIYERGDLKVG